MQVKEVIGAEGSRQKFVQRERRGQGEMAGGEAGLGGRVCYSCILYFP